MEPGGPSLPHVLVPSPRVVTDECYPFTSQESQPAAQPCMMHSRSTGRGKRQATARCPNPQTHANEIYQSTPAYRLSSSVSACGTGTGRAASVGEAGAVWCGERERGLARGGFPRQAKFGNEAGKNPLRSPQGSCSSIRHLHNTHPWVPKRSLPASPGGGEGSAGGPGPSPGPTQALCLQEKEIMKELLENGPVQGREPAWAPHPCAPKPGAARGVGELPCLGPGAIVGARTPLLGCSP